MVKIENNNRFKIGDTVWWVDPWGNLMWGVIYAIDEGNVAALIYKEGRVGACSGAKLCDCWPDKETCLAMEKKKSDLQVEEYKAGISNVEDLVRFLYTNDLNSENPDYEARRAAKERAEELMGIRLEG